MNRRKKFADKINISGRVIKKYRTEKQMSREELSNKLLMEEGVDISAQSIANIENNIRTVTDYELYAISRVLKVDVKLLLSEYKPNKNI